MTKSRNINRKKNQVIDLVYIKSMCDIDPITDCWLWSRCIGKKHGYGQIGVNGKSELVHRIALALSGAIPPYGKTDALHNDSLCHGRRHCCNPGHLRYGDDQDNSNDLKALAWFKGPNHPSFKYTDDTLAEIRKMRAIINPATGKPLYTFRELSAQFNCSSGYISDIVNGRWR